MWLLHSVVFTMAPRKKSDKDKEKEQQEKDKAEREKQEKKAAAAAQKKRKNPSPRKLSRSRQPPEEPPEERTDEEEATDVEMVSEVGSMDGSEAGTSRRDDEFPLEVDQRIADFYRAHPMYYDIGDENFKKKSLQESTLKEFADTIGYSGKCNCLGLSC